MLRTKSIYLPLIFTSAVGLGAALAATTANPAPTAAERAAAKTGNVIDQSVGTTHPVTAHELRSGVSLSGIKNPAQALATAQIKNREGEAIGTVSAVDVAPDGTAEAVHVDVGGFLGIGSHRVAIRASNFTYLKSRDLLVTSMSKDEMTNLPAERAPHG